MHPRPLVLSFTSVVGAKTHLWVTRLTVFCVLPVQGNTRMFWSHRRPAMYSRIHADRPLTPNSQRLPITPTPSHVERTFSELTLFLFHVLTIVGHGTLSVAWKTSRTSTDKLSGLVGVRARSNTVSQSNGGTKWRIRYPRANTDHHHHEITMMPRVAPASCLPGVASSPCKWLWAAPTHRR